MKTIQEAALAAVKSTPMGYVAAKALENKEVIGAAALAALKSTPMGYVAAKALENKGVIGKAALAALKSNPLGYTTVAAYENYIASQEDKGLKDTAETTTQNPNIKLDETSSFKEVQDNDPWVKAPFGGFAIGDPFINISDEINYEIGDDLNNIDLSKSPLTRDNVNLYIKSLQEEFYNNSVFAGTTDTSIGGNDALNPLWQFNIDDDIVWPSHQVDSTGRGLGRVYSDMYQNTQHILWLSFGVPKFAKLTDFYKEASDKKLSSILTKDGASLSYKIGAIIGEGVKIAIKLPWYPLIGLIKGTEMLADALVDVKVNKYYEFIPKMDLYYKVVTTLLAHLTVGMNLSPNGDVGDEQTLDNTIYSDNELNAIQNQAPEILRRGPDILYILSKRARWESSDNEEVTTALIDKRIMQNASSTWGFFNDAIFKRYQYVGFRIERGTDASESVSNSVGEAEINSKLNSAVSTANEKKFSLGGGGLGSTANIASSIKNVATAVKNTVSGSGSGEDLSAAAISIVSQGSGFFDIPEVWKSSSFSKSYSFDIQLRARYGDPLTVYQSIYVPLAMIMAGAFPIGLGKNTYTSPFLCQAFSRGMFSIPTGIIESMSIKRGLPEHGWTYEHLPTAVDISISIKDLSPAMFLSLVDANVLKVLGGNDSMKMYLSTLAGLNIYDLTNKLELLIRRSKALMLINKATWLNPRFYAIKASNATPIKAAATLMRGKWKTPGT